MSAALLDARDLTATFSLPGARLWQRRQQVTAVAQISLTLDHGEALGIVGESGSGKTTVGRMLAGELRPDAGTIHVAGQPFQPPFTPDRRAAVQLVFQDTLGAFDPRLPIGRQLAEPLVIRGIDAAARRQRIDQALAAVGLGSGLLDRLPHEVSGGQRQRAVLARALALNPSVLVLDEPVSALDVSVQAQVVNHLAGLARDHGLGLVFISHDLGVVGHLCDRVAVMYLGRIVETGPVEAVFDRPAHPYTRALIDAIPVAHPAARRRRARLAGEPPSLLAPPSGCAFHPRCAHAVAACATSRPALRMVAAHPGHQAACHRLDEV
ncbi:oligopeptide/dipeptide ABC transporter ATP-binding protein [Tistrella sp. BH-R2-4]|uniref:Oligopeptide/dipeptide ABC transporter ATP-binding protein n=1 Tax=Tistrella arctica TaxID=3133430 RepID=A0ABU9YI24_9PROT